MLLRKLSNVIYNCNINQSSTGLYLYRNCVGNFFYNNTINNCGLRANCGGIRISEAAQENKLMNNIIFSCSGPELKAVGLNNRLNFNNWYDDDLNDFILTWDDMHYTSLDDYRRHSNQGLNSISADPRFVDLLNNDLHLQSDSPCIGAGTEVPISEDKDGNPINASNPFDIGAYFAVPNLQAPSNLRVLTN